MFKVGDEVKCVYGEGKKGTRTGHVYTVEGVHGSWMNLKSFKDPFHASCFREVNEMNPDKIEINGKAKPKTKGKTPANTYYVRKVGGGSPKVVHKTFDEARNEANRLAELTPDAEFQVLAVAYTVKKVPVYTTEAQEYTL